jgi:uncharacterized protein (TIGR02453 family)
MANKFEGFADAKASFFAKLAKNQQKDWFLAHKEEYEEGWQRPMTLLLEGVRDKLAGTYAPRDLGEPHVMRIYRDVRFSKDKSPYKTWIGGGVPIAQPKKKKMPEAPSALYFHVSTKDCFAGAGLYMMDPPTLEKFRKALLDEKRGKELMTLTNKLAKKGYTFVAAETLKKPPKGVEPDHPRVELLKKKGLVVMFPKFPRTELAKSALVDRLAKAAKECAPVVTWLASATGA